jgi:hypothetical protein
MARFGFGEEGHDHEDLDLGRSEPEARMKSFAIEGRFQGMRGIGQGGYLAGLIASSEAGVRQVDFRNPIPLETELLHEETAVGARVRNADTVIIETRPGSVPSRTPEFVDLDAAKQARHIGERHALERISWCFSCGSQPDTLRIHAGAVGDGRFATPYVPPEWTRSEDGNVAPSFVWAPLDCASGWGLTWDPPRPTAVTGFLTVDILGNISPGQTYVIVAENGEQWRARKRWSWSAMYTEQGELVARSESLWISLP